MNSSSKRFVLLVNSAPLSREYFTRLGNELEEKGAVVGYALDSHLSDVTSGEHRSIPEGQYFTDYCRAHAHDVSVAPNGAGLTWSSLLSDFDRFLTYRMTPPLAADSPIGFANIVVLLENFFEAYFDEFRPDAVVYEPVSNSFAIAAYRAACRRNIPFFSLSLARIPGHIEISPSGFFHDHETVGRFLDRIKREGPQPHSREIAQDYITNIDNRKPDYMLKGGDGAAQMAIGLTGRYLNREKWNRLKSVLTYRRKYKDDMKLAYQVGDPLLVSWALLRRSVERRLKFRTVSKLYQSKPKSSRYFLYPLHYHPEASSSVLAPDYIDEMNVIKSIAFRLPLDVKLVVKEHPSATALQPMSFYRDLDAMPNVELVSPDLNPKALARDAIGVITLTSTLGFEAAALNKPVICLGDVLFGYFPNVRMIKNYSDLNDSLAWALDYKPLDPETIVEAMTAYVEYCDRGSFSFKGSLNDPSAIANVARLLLEKLDFYREPVLA